MDFIAFFINIDFDLRWHGFDRKDKQIVQLQLNANVDWLSIGG